MELLETGNATPEKRKARPVLTVGRPLIEKALNGGKFDFDDIADARLWGIEMLGDRDR